MTAFPVSLGGRPNSDRNTTHAGIILSVQLADGGTDPGPASKMSYTVEINDFPGPLTGIVPSEPRWDDSWDVDSLKPGPITVHFVRGQLHIMAHEERAAEECP